MKLISEQCSLVDFCSKVIKRAYFGIMEAASAEISYQRRSYREKTGQMVFPKGSHQEQYCQDLQALVYALTNGNFPEHRRAGLVRDIVPMMQEILKEYGFNGNIQQLVEEELVKHHGLNLGALDIHGKADTLVIVVSREEVNSVDIEPALEILKQLISSPEMATNYKEKIDISFHGYETDSSELFEIPEVRNYVYKLDTEFPFWLYFLSKYHLGLQALLWCFLPPYLTEEAKAEIFPQKIDELLTKSWLPAMNHIGKFVEMSDKENKIMTERAMRYITQGRFRESNIA